MSYMSKNERRTAILHAAVQVALREGFNHITTRKVCTELGVSTGLLHHHFASTAALKNELFCYFTQQDLLQTTQRSAHLSPSEQLFLFLDYSSTSLDDPSHKLWNDAWAEALYNEGFCRVYADALNAMHAKIVCIISAGCENGEFQEPEDKNACAWRLMAFSQGMVGIFLLNKAALRPESIPELLKATIRNELGASAA